MVIGVISQPPHHVALLAEGVDRNEKRYDLEVQRLDVALLAEGVDRNWLCTRLSCRPKCRPPRGGRG